MQKKFLYILFIFSFITVITWVFGACSKNDTAFTTRLEQEVPAGFPEPQYRFNDNPLTKEGFELGRKLFYDGRLSIDGNFPCASCHEQRAAFGTFEHDRSHGYNNSHTLRNAPPLFNLAWKKEFHRDGGFSSLMLEAHQPITSATEMAGNFKDIVAKLDRDDGIREMFKSAFGSSWITEDRITKALSQFTGYLVSANSKYDKYKKGEVPYSAQEQNGYQLFLTSCSSCHPEPLFTDYSYRNTGLPVDPVLNDLGRMRVTGNADDNLKFQVPALRNVYISSNYMHDGRFNTLAQCINHYRSGVQISANVDPLVKNGISLTNTEAQDIAVFLRTLTDSSFLIDPRFKKP
jgi:cytochrome c peroxidase